jgi:hypothetical protein
MPSVPGHASRSPALPPGAPPSLRLLSESVRCHVPVQPGHPRHGTEPGPAGIFYGPLTDPAGTGGRRCAWSVRFVTSLGPGGRTSRQGQAGGAHPRQRPAGCPRHPARSQYLLGGGHAMNRHDSPPDGHGASGCQDITDPATGGSRLLSGQCATCILRVVDCT